MSNKKNWKTVQIPEGMLSKIDELILTVPELGYSSRSEFIKEAIRLRILEIEQWLRNRRGR